MDGKHVVKCPNKSNLGVTENTTKNMEKMRNNRKKRALQNSKKQNLATAKLTAFDKASQQRIREQILQADTNRVATDGVRVGSSVTTPIVQHKNKILAAYALARVIFSLLM